MGRRAFITGITGQDAAYLARLLLDRGYSVAGGARHIAGDSLWRLRELGVLGRVDLAAFDLRDTAALRSALAAARPDEIYNFAALSFVGVALIQSISGWMMGMSYEAQMSPSEQYRLLFILLGGALAAGWI